MYEMMTISSNIKPMSIWSVSEYVIWRDFYPFSAISPSAPQPERNLIKGRIYRRIEPYIA